MEKPVKKEQPNLLDDPNREYVVGLLKALGGIEKSVKDLNESPTLSLLQEIANKLENSGGIGSFMWKLLKGDKGDKGVQGDKGIDADEEKIFERLVKRIPEPIKGDQGIEGKAGKDGKNGKDGKDGKEIDMQDVITRVLSEIPKQNVENLQKVVDKIRKERKITVADITDFPDIVALIKKYTAHLEELGYQTRNMTVGGGANALLSLLDVDKSSLANGKVPTWDSTLNKFTMQTPSGGGGGGAITINSTTITSGTSGRLLYDNSGTVGELDTATYPSLTELSYVKGVTSSLQTQITAKEDLSNKSTTVTLGTSNTLYPTQNAVKTYVDNLLTGLQWKTAVVAATTTNGALATAYENGDTIDGVTLTAGDRILLKNQTTQTENGIYIVAASGAPSRSTDADTDAELVNATVFVRSGTVNADTQWTCTNDTITLGSTNIVFAQVSGAGTYSAETGLTLTANSFSIDTTITVDKTTVQTLTNKTLTTPTITTAVLNGTVSGTSVATAATASTLVLRDANGNSRTANFLEGYTTTATAAGTTTLTVSSNFLQFFTGSTTQTVTMPVTSTLALGQQYCIVNNSTGLVTVNSSGANAIVILAAGTSVVLTCILTSGTTAASWSASYAGIVSATGKKLTVSNNITLAGTDGTTMTFPSTTATIARTDAAQTFTGVQTMTSPKIITQISDTNGNILVSIGATASAVNYVKITNAATGTTGALISAEGETNTDLRLAGKGTGKIHKTTGAYGDITADSDGATITFNMATSNLHSVTMAGNRTLAVSNVSVGQVFILRLTQDGTGTRVPTWFTTIKWAGGAAPTLTTTINKTDVFGFLCTSAGNYDGFVIGQNL